MNQTTINKFDVKVPKNKKNPFSISPISGETAETGHRKKKHSTLNRKLSLIHLKPQLNSEEESKSHSSGRSNTSNQEASGLPLNPQSPSAEAFSVDERETFVPEETGEAQNRELLISPVLGTQRGEISLNSNEVTEQEVEIESQRNQQRRYTQTLLTGFCERTATISFLRKNYVMLLSVFVCSSAALALKDLEKLMPLLFLVSYFCLVYQVAENLMQFRAGRTAHQKIESAFEIAEGVSLVIFLLSLNLYYYNRASFGMLIVPLLFLVETLLYMKSSSLSQTEKETKVIMKILYLVQSALIAAKINNLSDSEWKWTLIVIWIYLGAYACYIVFAGLVLISVTFASVLQMNTAVLSALKKRILGYIWHICFYGLNAVALIILLGIFQKFDGQSEEDFLEFGLKTAKNLSFFLLIYTILALPFLKESCAGPFQDLGSRTQDQNMTNYNPRKSHQLIVQNQNKTAFFLMISPTYFGFLKSGTQPPTKEQIQKAKKKLELIQDQEISSSNYSSRSETHQKQEDIVKLSPKKGEEKEENLCYICENNVSSAILTECGHGGVCCDCAIKSIEQKNECMECRMPVGAIYKVEESSKKFGVIKAYEIIQIITIDDD